MRFWTFDPNTCRFERASKQAALHAADVAVVVVDADPARGGPAGIHHDHHPAVTFGPPRAHYDIGATGRCPPVDGADVISDDVFTQ